MSQYSKRVDDKFPIAGKTDDRAMALIAFQVLCVKPCLGHSRRKSLSGEPAIPLALTEHSSSRPSGRDTEVRGAGSIIITISTTRATYRMARRTTARWPNPHLLAPSPSYRTKRGLDRAFAWRPWHRASDADPPRNPTTSLLDQYGVKKWTPHNPAS